MRRQPELVAAFSERTETLAQRIDTREYIAMARGHRAWIALQAGDIEQALRLTAEAGQIWSSITLVFPFQWTALLPQLRANVRAERLDAAIETIPRLLDPSQQVLPGVLTDTLTRAQRSWSRGAREQARALLVTAIHQIDHNPYN